MRAIAKSNFEKLKVYSLSEKLADEIWKVARTWDHFTRDTVGKQIVRAADSIGANIAEGTGRGSVYDNRRFVRVARGSLYETRHWLRRSFQRKLLTSEQTEQIKVLIENLSPMLNAYLRALGKKCEKD
jgi:four helix bundle protein